MNFLNKKNKKNNLISKTDFINFQTCKNKVWKKHNEGPITIKNKHILEEGIKFGEKAQELFPNSILIKYNYKNSPINTNKLLKKRKTLCEAGFKTCDCYCLVDILNPQKNNTWDIIEVKSSSSLNKLKIYKLDLAFQKYVLEKNNIQINKCYLMYANKNYKLNKKLNIKELFLKKDLTDEINEIILKIPQKIEEIKNYITKKLPINFYENCKNPKKCDCSDLCYVDKLKNIPFYCMRNSSKLKLINNGYLKMTDFEETDLKNDKHKIQMNCFKTKKNHLNKKEINKFLSKLKKPYHFLDFETIDFSIPVFNKTSTWNKIPFQYSLDIIYKDNKIKNFSYLTNNKNDPRENLIKMLIKNVKKKGSIIVYYENFEKMILKNLGIQFPKYKEELNKISKRIIDLYKIFYNFYYYNNKQCGSTSLKNVLPCFTNKTYKSLKIQNGIESLMIFKNLYFKNLNKNKDKRVERVRKRNIRKDLLEYCQLDTYAMILILQELKNLIK